MENAAKRQALQPTSISQFCASVEISEELADSGLGSSGAFGLSSMSHSVTASPLLASTPLLNRNPKKKVFSQSLSPMSFQDIASPFTVNNHLLASNQNIRSCKKWSSEASLNSPVEVEGYYESMQPMALVSNQAYGLQQVSNSTGKLPAQIVPLCAKESLTNDNFNIPLYKHNRHVNSTTSNHKAVSFLQQAGSGASDDIPDKKLSSEASLNFPPIEVGGYYEAMEPMAPTYNQDYGLQQVSNSTGKLPAQIVPLCAKESLTNNSFNSPPYMRNRHVNSTTSNHKKVSFLQQAGSGASDDIPEGRPITGNHNYYSNCDIPSGHQEEALLNEMAKNFMNLCTSSEKAKRLFER